MKTLSLSSRSHVVWLMFFLCILGVVLPVAAAHAEPTLNSVLRAVPVPGRLPVKLGGDLSNWDRSGQIVLADDIDQPHYLVRVSAMYDSTGLYLAFEFKDPTPMVNHVDPQTTPGKGWCGDAVQLRINTGSDNTDMPFKPMQILHVDGYWYTDAKQPVAYVVYGDLGPDGGVERTIPQAIGQGVDMAFKADADGQGYVQEMRLSWALLRPNAQPYKPGQSLHLAIEAMWGNTQARDDPAYRITDLLNPKHPEREMLWTNPPAWGTVEFTAQGNLKLSDTAKLWPQLLQRYEAWRKVAATEPAQSVVNRPRPLVNRPCALNGNEVCRLLNQWFTDGTAAGNVDDYYDNRDRGHSGLDLSQYPQLHKVEYTKEQLDLRADWGLCLDVRPYVTVGNSSTSAPPDRGGSNPRFAQMDPALLTRIYAQYRGGNLYIYPAHLDYAHPNSNDRWSTLDLYPLNTPYTLISYGSSGTDQPFMNAWFYTLAAFDPKIKSILFKNGLLMPTIQAIFRASNKQVVEPEDYFTGKAHPAVFRGDQVDALKMVRAAHEMKLDTVPPLAQLRVVEEDKLRPGVDVPEGSTSEILCDSPGVIGRIHRRWARAMRLRVSAAGSLDLQGKPLTFRWVLLQGDPKLVRIKPDADGRWATLTLTWHDRIPVQPAGKPLSNRVDIGVFAGNGKAWSVPAFICVEYPDNELRTYDDHDRLVDIFYAAGGTNIGFDTAIPVKAGGTSSYEIRDWAALMDLACGKGDSLTAQLFHAALNDTQRAYVAMVHRNLADRIATIKANETEVKPAVASASPLRPLSRRDIEWIHQPLVVSTVKDQPPVKAMLEDILNTWKNDPFFYLNNRKAIDDAAAKLGSNVRQSLTNARQRLVDLGIYQPTPGGGWTLHSIHNGDAPAVQRLTRYERLELQRFHLALLNETLLPRVLVRAYAPNYVDPRMVCPQPYWDTFTYSSDLQTPPKVNRRQTDPLMIFTPLDKP